MSSTQRRVVITGVGLICPLGSTKEALWSGAGAAAQRRHVTCGWAGTVRHVGENHRADPARPRWGRGQAVHRRHRRFRAPGQGAEEGDPQGAEGDVPRVPDGRGRRPMGSGRRRHPVRVARSRPDAASRSARTTCSRCPRSLSRASCSALTRRAGSSLPRWGGEGMTKMSPLWLLKYLPNMPASHLAIYNDFRGPNNSLTMREAAANAALGEAFRSSSAAAPT